MTPGRLEDHERAAWAWLALDGAGALIQAWASTAPARTQHDRRVLGEGGAELRRPRQHDGPLAAPRVEDLTPLAPPGIAMALGTPYAPRRFAAQSHPRLALAAGPTARRDVPALFRRATREPLRHPPGGLER